MAKLVDTLKVEVDPSVRVALLLRAAGSFLISLALAVVLVGATYCAVIEVRHIHRSLIHAD